MIKNRFHTASSEALVNLRELCRRAGLEYPLLVERDLGVELLPATQAQRSPDGEPIHWRNLPACTYSTVESDAERIIEMLAYEAHEWKAREVMLRRNQQRRTRELA